MKLSVFFVICFVGLSTVSVSQTYSIINTTLNNNVYSHLSVKFSPTAKDSLVEWQNNVSKKRS